MTDGDTSLGNTSDEPVAVQLMTAAPVLPPEFWAAEALQAALQSHHFGHVLKAYRSEYSPVLKQGVLATWLGLTQGQISRIERADAPICDLVKLSAWAVLLHMPTSLLWFIPESKECSSVAQSPIMDATKPEDEHVQRRTLLKTFGIGASLLAGAPHVGDQAVSPTALASFALDKRDIAIMREMTVNFRHLDNRFGGGHAYSVVDNYLKTHVEPSIRYRHFSENLRSELFLAAIEMYQLAGWMAHDTGDPAVGNAHLTTALNLCKEIQNDALAAEMLAGMSHQAAFNRQADTAVQLASAAGYAARRAGIPRLQAESSVMEAHGLALRGDHRGCIAALQSAEKFFVRHADAAPDWLAYFDEAYLSAKFGHALRDLGRPVDAERFARNSLTMTEGYERGRLFNTALLAGILADQGKVHESVQHAQLAVQMSGSMRSARTTAYLVDVHHRLRPHRDQPEVKALYRSMKSVGVSGGHA